jgi:hypothetical protein
MLVGWFEKKIGMGWFVMPSLWHEEGNGGSAPWAKWLASLKKISHAAYLE